MSYHSEGTMTLVNDDGIKSTYKIETFGNLLVLISEKGQWEYISNKHPILVEKVQKDIEELKDQINIKDDLLKMLKQREVI